MTANALRHHLYLYDDIAAIGDDIAPFLADGLERDEAVLAVVDAATETVLRDAMESADSVVFLRSNEVYVRAESAIAAYDSTLRRSARDGVRRVRAFARVPAPADEASRRHWLAYEAIVNAALAHHPMWVLCGYTTRGAPPETLEGVLRSHSEVLDHGWHRSASFDEPEHVLRDLQDPPSDVPPLRTLDPSADGRAFRAALAREISASEEFILAAGEVFTNAQRHGGGVAEIRVGRDDYHVVCEISDRGPGLDDPLIGHLPPGAPGSRGAGLWVARQLTHRLEVLSAAGTGTTVRLWG
jgi:anti-sigma regulatory factor (Ser/Thr protein kinase)